ncbi:MAG: response regulator [Acetatifactor sp.]|nr:response regulator [Acetatifactor sp.]
MKILLVDDDEVIRAGMRKIITGASNDWEVVAEAADGEIALRELAKFPDTELIITDVRMPIMDGIELIRRVREQYPELRIIVLSGYDDYNYVRTAFMSGAVDYLLKPFQKKELLERIEKVEKTLFEDKITAESNHQNKAVLVAEYMKKLMNAKEDVTQCLEKLGGLGIATGYSCYMAVRAMVDQYYKQFLDADQYERKLVEDEERLARALQQEKDCSYCYFRLGQEIVLLLFADSQEVLSRLAQTIHDVLKNGDENENTGTVGQSRIHLEKDEIPQAFEEAEIAVLSRFYLGQNQLIAYEDVEGKCIDIVYDLEPMVSTLIHDLELCDYIKAKKAMEQIFLDLSYCHPDKFRKYMHNLIDMLIVRVKDFENVLRTQGQDVHFFIDYLNTYRELKTYMNSLLLDVVEYIRAEREKKSKKRIELAKTFIEEHYRDQITLNDIADYVELNASYFSNLFKVETGMNFSEYLLNIRMEHAKKLLRDPKIKVYEIGNMVGYEDAVSFGRAFKKKYDMSPKDYRNSVY